MAEIKHSAQISTMEKKDSAVDQLKLRHNFECSEGYINKKTLGEYNGRTSPVPDIADSRSRTLSIAYDTYVQAEVEAIKALEDSNKILYFADNRGRTMYCIITSLTIKNKKKKTGYSVSIDLTEVDSGV